MCVVYVLVVRCLCIVSVWSCIDYSDLSIHVCVCGVCTGSALSVYCLVWSCIDYSDLSIHVCVLHVCGVYW